MEARGLDRIDFKAAEGFVTLTREEALAIARAVAEHVQRCFSAERAAHVFIDGLRDTDIPASCSLADFMGDQPVNPSLA